jgi:hypothetical protein
MHRNNVTRIVFSILIVFSSLAYLISPSGSVVAQAGSNLVLNPGFETQGNSVGDAANWTEGTNHVRASDKFHTGGWSLHSTYRGAGTDTRTTAPIAVSPNTTYTYSGYIWRTNSTGAACMDMADLVGERQLCTRTTGSWQYLSGTWNSGSNTSLRLRLITDGSPTGDIWFDDISLDGPGGTPVTDTPAPPVTNTSVPATNPPTNTSVPPITNTPTTDGNLVLNPGFETQGTSAADAANWLEGTNHARSSDKFHTGGWSLRSTYQGTGTATRTTAAIAVNPNTTYTYSGYIWRTNSTGAACMDMADIVGERQLCTSASGSWQSLSGTWNSGSNTSVTLRLITDGSPTGDIWFDDIALVGPGGTPVTDTPVPPVTNTVPPVTNTPAPATHTPTNTSVPPITNTPSTNGNLVLNSGFETQATSAADAANWLEGTNHARSSDKFHTGGWSLRSTYRSTGTATRTTAPIAVNPNTDYTYSGYVWRTNSTGAACMDMSDLVGERQLCTSAAGSWQFLSGTWNSGSNTSVTLRLITDGSPTGDIWFDDISLVGPGGPTATPVNTNTPGPSPTATNTQPPSSCTPVALTKGPHVIFPGNNTQMQVSWQWSSTATFQVQWGTDQTYSLGNQSVTAYDTTNRLYKYTISGLTPGLKYYYRAVVGSQCAGGTFYAAPSTSATNLKFFAYGDTRSHGDIHDGIAARMIQKYTADPALQTLNIQVGDWVNTDTESSWTSEWFAYPNIRALTANIAYMGVRGNHEYGATYWQRYFPQPYQPGGLYFSFDYGPMHVVMLDQYIAYGPGSAQHNWLKADLAASTKQWKVIVLHEPGWTAGGGHGNNTTAQTVIQPLAEQYGVAIVFGGHNHYYSRAVVNGVQHLTIGTGGASLTTPDPSQPYVVKTSKSYGWGQYVINGNTLTATVYDNSGNIIETYTITR